jgi:hypothetical protein
MMSNELDRGLPKWPQMIVWGTPISEDKALEIIRRTDSFFVWGGGNSREFNKRLRARLGMPKDYLDMSDDELEADNWFERAERTDSWRERWGYIDTEYVHNSWISCAFVGGPHGWCHPDGTIGYCDNVGKWPSCDAVLADWQKLAGEFPFLDMHAVLMSGESCEEDSLPVCGFRIEDGSVSTFDPLLPGVNIPRVQREFDAVAFAMSLNDSRRELGLSEAHLCRFEAKAKELGLVK